MPLVLKILQCLAIVMAAVMFAAAFDVGHFGLKGMISPLAIGPVVLFAILSIVPIFLTAKSTAPEALDDEGVATKLAEIQAKLNSRLAALQTKVDELTSQDKESLEEENLHLKEQLEAIKLAEREKVENDAQQLRQRNEELESQIKQWAIDSVGGSISDTKPKDEAA